MTEQAQEPIVNDGAIDVNVVNTEQVQLNVGANVGILDKNTNQITPSQKLIHTATIQETVDNASISASGIGVYIDAYGSNTDINVTINGITTIVHAGDVSPGKLIYATQFSSIAVSGSSGPYQILIYGAG